MPDIAYPDIEAAAQRLAGVAHRTPVLTSKQVDGALGAQIYFKCENFQRAGAFKFRGAYNTLSRFLPKQRAGGAVAFSSGNHAQAVALAARLLGISATIVMPRDAPSVKREATEGYGASVIPYDREREDREAIARRIVAERGATLVVPFDNADVIAGQGTVAKELLEETGPLDFLFVCVGGGGLIAGCALAAQELSPGCQVYGVEPEAGNDAQQSLRSGRIVRIPVPRTIADGAQTPCVGNLTFPIMQRLVRDILTVSDDQLRAQMRFFAQRMKIVVEPTGCLAAAAVMNNLVPVRGRRVGVIISGGNVDLAQFAGTA
ncbi:MAG TPA: threo-3-hydroxy-L-aspartate ammonia-lyase [Steroidobacteraceae bacterium]|nr:threo-3-hydroxy-L-aspartate ammonia-lyase [Steroidobacteraceae bacterium]